MRRNLFGKHLYNQIVIPLVLASLVVGVVATIVAVYFLGGLTDTWVDQIAKNAVSNLGTQLNHRARDVGRVADMAAEDDRLRSALRRDDMVEARGLITQMNTALEFDNMMLIDEAGVVVATTGLPGVELGSQALREEERSYTDLAMAHPAFLDLGDEYTLTSLQPISIGSNIYTLALSWVVDDDFLATIAGGVADAACFYDQDMERVACTLPQEGDDSFAQVEEIRAVFAEPGDEVIEALQEASVSGESSVRVTVGDSDYEVRVSEITLEGDPTEAVFGYVVSMINHDVSEQAGRTTTNLITMWSIFAVLALVGLGGWVARRVSEPLGELTEGARKIADGDFSTKIHVSGSNEISDLAESFNQMTDSLRERSESLTKKVLELATLYEMSRALGATLDMDMLLDSVLDSALRIFNLDSGYVTIRDQETGLLDLKAWRGPGAERPDEKALRSSMSEWVIREGRPLIFNPSSGEQESGEVDSVTGALAALCVPLVSGEGALGAIIVGSHDPEFRFTSDDVRLLSTIANHVTIAIGNIELFTSLQEAYLSTVRSLAAAVDAKDTYTRGHSDRVAQFADILAEQIDLSVEQRTALEMAAYLHDIGKIGVKEEILLKPGRLTDDEMDQMRHHPLIGANILKPVGFPWPITPIVRHHHERWDGGGYPAGLKGEEIPLLARVLTVADAFEAMIADRPYRAGRSEEEGIIELQRCSGEQFDPGLVDPFVEAMARRFAEGEVGLAVSLDDVQPDEVRAIFVAICEGMINSFRKLGGPRLAANVEQELNLAFEEARFPVEVSSGRLTVHFDGDATMDEEIKAMQHALRIVDKTMGRMSGHTLVDHFYSDAVAGLSDRMRRLAHSLDLYVS